MRIESMSWTMEKLPWKEHPEEIFSQVEKLKELRLDVPQVTELAHELRQKGVPLPPCIAGY